MSITQSQFGLRLCRILLVFFGSFCFLLQDCAEAWCRHTSAPLSKSLCQLNTLENRSLTRSCRRYRPTWLGSSSDFFFKCAVIPSRAPQRWQTLPLRQMSNLCSVFAIRGAIKPKVTLQAGTLKVQVLHPAEAPGPFSSGPLFQGWVPGARFAPCFYRLAWSSAVTCCVPSWVFSTTTATQGE